MKFITTHTKVTEIVEVVTYEIDADDFDHAQTICDETQIDDESDGVTVINRSKEENVISYDDNGIAPKE